LAAFRYQRDGLATSPLYHHLLGVAVDDAEAGGVCAEVLALTPQGVEPVLDALPLRFLGGVHRLVLDGDSPDLARFYPSVGGTFAIDDPVLDPAPVFLATVAEHRDRVVDALARSVQTNEVGRCASLLPGFLAVAESTGLPLRILELGTSAGLNLRWDHYRYEGGANGSTFGDPDSMLQFAGVYVDPLPRLDVVALVVERRGCDRSPIDATSADGSQLLRSFVWPDQLERFRALDAALALAPSVPVVIDRADAAEWVADQLGRVTEGVATVLFQSIVWQYLTRETRAVVRNAVREAGAMATASAPVAWLRMEPGADPKKGADVRLSQWPPGEDRSIALTGYHGQPVSLRE
jgi:hypothetical protein